MLGHSYTSKNDKKKQQLVLLSHYCMLNRHKVVTRTQGTKTLLGHLTEIIALELCTMPQLKRIKINTG